MALSERPPPPATQGGVPEAITVLAATIAVFSGLVAVGFLDRADLRRIGTFVLSWSQREANPLRATVVICLVLYVLLAWDTGRIDLPFLEKLQPWVLIPVALAVLIAISNLVPNPWLGFIGALGLFFILTDVIRTPSLVGHLALYVAVALVPVGVFQAAAHTPEALHPSLANWWLPIVTNGSVVAVVALLYWLWRRFRRNN